MARGTMRSARSRFADLRTARVPRPARLPSLWLLGAVLMTLIRGTPPARAIADLPIRLYPRAGWGQPAVDETTVYYLSKRHALIVVDRGDGRPRWTAALGDTGTTTAGTTVVFAGSLVVAGDHDLFAFERSTGTKRWRFRSDPDAGVGRYLGDASGTDVLTGSASGRAYAIDGRTGLLRWASVPVAATGTMFPPVVTGDGLVAGFTDRGARPRAGGVAMIDRETGAFRWRSAFDRRSAESASSFAGGPVVVGDLIVAASSDGTVHALDRITGASRWRLPPVHRVEPAGDAGVPEEDFRAIAASGRTVVIGSTTGVLSGVDVDTRQEVWRFASPADGSIGFALHADERAAYVPYLSGALVAVSLRDGRERWRVGGTDLPLFWPPTRRGRFLYATTEGGLYALHD